MAMRCQCVANRLFPRHRSSRVWSRSFTDGNNHVEEPPRVVPWRTRMQRESTEAVQNLARSTLERAGVVMRSISLQPTSGANSGDTQSLDFPPQRSRHSPTLSRGPRKTYNPNQSGQDGSRGSYQSDRPAGFGRSPRGQTTRGRGGRGGRGGRRNASAPMDREEGLAAEEEEEMDFWPDLDSGGDAMTTEEHDALLEKMGIVDKDAIQTHPGPHLDMANMMLEHAPRHFGVTEPVSGEYPSLTDSRSRGLLQDIIKQVRKNETYSEKNIQQLIKKLGPAMPSS